VAKEVQLFQILDVIIKQRQTLGLSYSITCRCSFIGTYGLGHMLRDINMF